MKLSKQKQFICDTYWENKEMIYANALLLMGDHFDAEDIALDVLVHSLEKYNLGFNKKVLKSWLFKAKCHKCIDSLRRKKRLDEKLTLLTNIEKTGVEIDIPEDMLLKKEYSQEFWDCFHTLSEENQRLLILYAYEELTYAQIASMYGISKGAVKSRIFYARKLLRESLLKANAKRRNISDEN